MKSAMSIMATLITFLENSFYHRNGPLILMKFHTMLRCFHGLLYTYICLQNSRFRSIHLQFYNCIAILKLSQNSEERKGFDVCFL